MSGRVLIVDDDVGVLAGYTRVLSSADYSVCVARSGEEALTTIDNEPIDVVLSDISMPGMSGMEFLRHVRERDPDLPVLLITGAPTLETAIEAVEFGAFRYFRKPVDIRDLRHAVGYAARLRRLTSLKRQALDLVGGGAQLVGERIELESSFRRALDGLWIAYQPIVSASTTAVYGYEALLRSSEPSLPNPPALIEAATSLGELRNLGRRIRAAAVEPMVDAPQRGMLFVNLHPYDLSDDALFDPKAPLSRMSRRVVLEMTERASIDRIPDVRQRIANLREMGFRIAVDDLGAGYAGLNSFAQLEPHLVKLDLVLVRDIEKSPVKQRLIGAMVELCHGLESMVVAEGVETAEERDCLRSLGCDLLQGYLFARPDRAFPEVAS